ncbi:hypothetical protein [Micromonospora sp. WMMD1082]|uniref:hypothetical protein n=1 Tax=Micromonospora sp. WMMD1082 TaxID=3016104 RepID=UPI002415B9DD|nr:hypothetical protein [Micromonospora sp. WMMD1082]MDG4793610.1 hypothetical protein [Micromonospora sp. WMMD1082]
MESGVAPSAAAGVALAAALGGSVAVREVGVALLSAFEEHLRRFQPQRRGRRWLLDEEAEASLDQMCFALAWFDRVYRDGSIPVGSPLTSATIIPTGLEGLLEAVPDYAIMDLQVQIRLAERALGTLRDAVDEADCHAAPTFAGSGDVNGADADLIIGGRLIDIKAVSQPGRLGDHIIWQLAGYVLLDYDDRYGIEVVGFYMARIGVLAVWPVDEFFRMLGCRVPLHRLRAEFADRCASLVADATTFRR